MPVCSEFIGGVLTQVSSSIESCSGYIVLTSQEYTAFNLAVQLDPKVVSVCVVTGMSFIIGSYFLGYPIGIGKSQIRRI